MPGKADLVPAPRHECPICDASTTVLYDEIYDDRYGYPGRFELCSCARCGHRHLNASFTPEQLGTLYSDYYPRSSFSVDDYAPHVAVGGFSAWFNGERCAAFRWVPERVRILDIGCGFCQTLGYHNNRGCESFGVEIDTNAKRVADKFGLNVKIGVFDPRDYPADYFDYVTLDQVIEHVVDPRQMFAGIRQVLKPGGTAILSTPNSHSLPARIFGRCWLNWHAPYHLQHFSRESFGRACEQAGLKLVETRTVTHSEWLGYQWQHYLRFPQPGQPSAFWSRTPIADSMARKILFRALGIIHRLKVNHVLTRLFDLFGGGDNILYFVRKPDHA
ncbi:MAG: hypothetical protein JWN73_5083 [Betaproteobacteria bacterium]|nr:hypothetical protein [Betaproteobacteria bacterium]